MRKLMTQAQFARRMKYTRGRISQLVKSGIIPLTNGRIDPIQAESAITANIDRSRRLELQSIKPNKKVLKSDQMKLSLKPKDDVLSLTQARRDHELLKMNLTDLELKVKRGDLVPKSYLTELVSMNVSNARSQLWGLPKRMAGRLAIITDEKEIENLLRVEIRSVL